MYMYGLMCIQHNVWTCTITSLKNYANTVVIPRHLQYVRTCKYKQETLPVSTLYTELMYMYCVYTCTCKRVMDST